MKTRNVTLSLPVELVLKLKVIAAKQDMSLSALAARQLARIDEATEGKDAVYEAAHQAMKKAMKEGFDLGIGDKVTWTRDSLYERR